MRILVIDANEVTLNFIKSILTAEGYLCNASADPWKGLHDYIILEHDVAIIRVCIAGLNVLEAIQSVNPAAKIVIVAEAADEAAVTANRTTVRWLVQPFDRAQLITALSDAITA